MATVTGYKAVDSSFHPLSQHDHFVAEDTTVTYTVGTDVNAASGKVLSVYVQNGSGVTNAALSYAFRQSGRTKVVSVTFDDTTALRTSSGATKSTGDHSASVKWYTLSTCHVVADVTPS